MNDSKYFDTYFVDLQKGYAADRGIIQPLCDLNMKSASIIVSKKNTWRANHYHKSDWHFIYVLQGSFEYYYKKTNSKDEIKKIIVTKDQLLFTGPQVDHAMFYTEETKLIVLSKNPRDQKTYEEDTVRINFMNDQNRF